jgi:DNA-directed RNA polymerase subunit M/transcription elongation factor TFIIS
MQFCSKCDNMYYLKITETDGNNLIYYCRNCGNEDTNLTKDNICVLDTTINQTKDRYMQIINPYTKNDPTLPRINSIKCPNQSCKSNTDASLREVIYIRYDDADMKYIYMCTFCDTIWKTDEKI